MEVTAAERDFLFRSDPWKKIVESPIESEMEKVGSVGKKSGRKKRVEGTDS